MLKLTLKKELTVPLEVDSLCAGETSLTLDEVANLLVFSGRRQRVLREFFEVEGVADGDFELHGDMKKLRWLGKGMRGGHIRVVGDIGFHLGSHMRGGSIRVEGNAGDWLGAEMLGGHVHVTGNVGGQVGGAYRGSPRGMRNGLISIDGNAGIEVGRLMRRGTIYVKGEVGDFAGVRMKGGSIVAGRFATHRVGARMLRGTILSLTPNDLLQTFTRSGDFETTYVEVFVRYLEQAGVCIDAFPRNWMRWVGDEVLGGQGEIWTPAVHEAA
ncbi:MAG: formylmethanofuran dehydrogenase subunit C [Planctomycetota bacterium]